MTQTKYYVEYRSGNCSVIAANSPEEARYHAEDFARSFQSRVTCCREATAVDLADFRGAVYGAER